MKAELILGIALVLSGHGNAAIVYPKAPAGGREFVSAKVGRMLRENPNGTLDSLRGLIIEDITIAEPHREYAVGAADLAAGRLLSSARPGSWRYFLMHGARAVGVADVSEADLKIGEMLRFDGLSESAFSNETLEALRTAKELPQIEKQDYELRFLVMPGINFAAAWFHGKSDDIIVPLSPTFGRKLTAEHPYSERQIIKVLRPEAKEVMKSPKLLR
jgi:hypothetical protein